MLKFTAKGLNLKIYIKCVFKKCNLRNLVMKGRENFNIFAKNHKRDNVKKYEIILPLRRSTAWPRAGWMKLKHSFTALVLPNKMSKMRIRILGTRRLKKKNHHLNLILMTNSVHFWL